jgi:hypothetical protein
MPDIDPPNDTTEEDLFHQALQRSPAERAPFLDQACAGDRALRARLQALIDAHEHPDAKWLQGSLIGAALPRAPAPSDAATDADGGASSRRIGPYTLLRELGEGGMGTVWLAEQSEPVRRQVALKVVKAGMDSASVIARFDVERQALALMDHPHIARVLDAGATASGQPYFVMEAVPGLPITEHCDRDRLGLRERLHLFVAVCHAVRHAHHKGVIHRDLKPSNVLWRRSTAAPCRRSSISASPRRSAPS